MLRLRGAEMIIQQILFILLIGGGWDFILKEGKIEG